MNFLSTQSSTDGSTSSEPMGLCITSIVKTLTDNHTLDDRNHQGHHTTLLLPETLLSTARGRQRAVCDNQHRAICPGAWQVLDSTWSTERGRQGSPVVPAGWCHPPLLKRILAWLQQRFPDRLISRRCDPQWSPHSPDLNPQDFYLWGYLKDRVYGNNPQTIHDLKAAITTAITAIPREECGRVIENFARWVQMCLQRRGAQLEHIFWAPVKQRVFVAQTWIFGDVCYTGLT